MEESIYNIIPREFVPPPKQPIYKSKYPPNIPPTGTTFCHHTTSKIHVMLTLSRTQIYLENSIAASKPTQSSGNQKH